MPNLIPAECMPTPEYIADDLPDSEDNVIDCDPRASFWEQSFTDIGNKHDTERGVTTSVALGALVIPENDAIDNRTSYCDPSNFSCIDTAKDFERVWASRKH